MTDGKPEEEAKRLAPSDWLSGFATDLIGGFISGDVMTSTFGGIDLATRPKNANTIQSAAQFNTPTNMVELLTLEGRQAAGMENAETPNFMDGFYAAFDEEDGTVLTDTAKSTARTGGVQYDLKGQKWLNEAQVKTALADVMDHGDMGYDNMVLLGDMPQFIQNISGIGGELYIFRNHAYENMATKEQAEADGRIAKTEKGRKRQHFHELGEETMMQAILALNKPLITIADQGADGNPALSMVLPVFDKQDNPIHAVVSFYANEPVNGTYKKRPHVAVTFYGHPYQYEDGSGRKTIVEVVNEAVREKRVLDYDNKKVRADLPVIAQDSTLGNITVPALEKSIAQFKREVNDFKRRNKIYYSLNEEADQEASLWMGLSRNWMQILLQALLAMVGDT